MATKRWRRGRVGTVVVARELGVSYGHLKRLLSAYEAPRPRGRLASGGLAWSARDIARLREWWSGMRRGSRVRVPEPDVRVASERVCSGIVAALESDAELLRRHGGLHTLALECLEMLRRHPLA